MVVNSWKTWCSAHGSWFQVYLVKWYMAHFGASSSKPTKGWCNHKKLARLDLGKYHRRIMNDGRKKIQTVRRSISKKTGKPSYTGTPHLKSTQFWAHLLLVHYPVACMEYHGMTLNQLCCIYEIHNDDCGLEIYTNHIGIYSVSKPTQQTNDPLYYIHPLFFAKKTKDLSGGIRWCYGTSPAISECRGRMPTGDTWQITRGCVGGDAL